LLPRFFSKFDNDKIHSYNGIVSDFKKKFMVSIKHFDAANVSALVHISDKIQYDMRRFYDKDHSIFFARSFLSDFMKMFS